MSSWVASRDCVRELVEILGSAFSEHGDFGLIRRPGQGRRARWAGRGSPIRLVQQSAVARAHREHPAGRSGSPVRPDRCARGVDHRPGERAVTLSGRVTPEEDEGRRIATLARQLRATLPRDSQNLGAEPQVRRDGGMGGERREIVADEFGAGWKIVGIGHPPPVALEQRPRHGTRRRPCSVGGRGRDEPAHVSAAARSGGHELQVAAVRGPPRRDDPKAEPARPDDRIHRRGSRLLGSGIVQSCLQTLDRQLAGSFSGQSLLSRRLCVMSHPASGPVAGYGSMTRPWAAAGLRAQATRSGDRTSPVRDRLCRSR